VDAERAMAALGGDVPACMQLLQLWSSAVASVDAGEVGSMHRLGDGGIDALTGAPAPVLPWAPPKLPFASRSRPGVRRSLMHAPLPAALEDVLAQGAVLACERRWEDPDLPDASRRTASRLLAERVHQAVTESLRPHRSHRHPLRVSLACRVAPDRSISVDVSSGRGHLRLDLVLPLGWLVRVWRIGVATAAGLLVIDVVEGRPGDERLGVTALDWDADVDGVHPRGVAVQLEREPGGHWVAADVDPAGVRARGQWWSIRAEH
jgi:hypothetical protein